MSDVNLDLSPLAQVIDRLDEGLLRYQRDVSDTQIRDGLIQRFEFTYELSHKMLKRYLEQASPSAAVFDTMAFADLIRTGNERSLLRSTWPRWRVFRDMRGKSSHTYDEGVALAVVAEIPDFLAEARHLLAQLQARVG